MSLFSQTQHYLSRRSKQACTPLLMALLLSGTAYGAGDGGHGTDLAAAARVAARVNVTGTVTDSKGEPLPGVSVRVKGGNTATSTDVNGRFSINLPQGNETLVFSFIGFKQQEVAVNGRTTVNVNLQEEAQSLTEVVVNVGYGSKKRGDIVGAVATVKAEDIEDLPVPNIAAALRNRVPGVSVDAVSGKPGSSITLNIRNSYKSDQASLLGVTNEPLYVIDGITVTRTDFDNLDPTMVEDVTFLKDASAAIYGAAGAKGVVLVTTKRGKPGKPKITYSGYRGVADAATKPHMLSAYDHAVLINDGFKVANANPVNLFSEEDLNVLKNMSNKSWFDELWGTAAVNRHNLNVTGGTDNLTFFAGGSYYNEGGNYGGIKYNKYTFRTGINTKILEGLNASVSLSSDFAKKQSNTYKNGGENDQSYFQQLVTTPKWVPLQINGLPVNYNGNTNPLAVVQSGNDIWSKTQGLAINANLEYKPKFLSGLSARIQFGKNNRSGSDQQYVPTYTVYNFQRTGQNNQLFSDQLIGPTTAVGGDNTSLLPSTGMSTSYQAIAALSYAKTFGQHSLDAMVAMDQSEGQSEELTVRWSGLVLDGVQEYWAFDQSSFTLHSKTATESVKRSYLGRFNYKFGNKYYLESIARLDASSNFADGHRWGLFPSVGLGWNISEEKFFKDNINFINFMKLRANYGLVGEDRVDQRLWQSRYRVDANGYLYGESLLSGANPQRVPNPDISWEKSRTLNMGMDAQMLDQKVSVGVDVYHRRSYDIFDRGNNENYPMYAGFEAPVVNYGERLSWGSEFSVGYKTKFRKNWGFNADMNFGFSNSVSVDQFYNKLQLWDFTYPDMKYFIGTDPKHYNSGNYGLISRGILKTQADVDALLNQYPNYTINKKVPQVGWLYYEDTDGDGKITEHDQVPMFDKTSSDFGLGLTLGGNYKTLSLSANIVARFGGKVFYDSKSKEPASFTNNVPSYWKDHWTPENPDAKFPRYDDPSIDAGWNSTFWAVDGTMIRINNMTLAYRLPKKLLNKMGFGDVRAVLTGNNLWTLKNPMDIKDPYSSTIYDYPTLRTISLGLNVSL